MTDLEKFNTYGALYIKDVVSKDVAHYLTQALMIKAHSNQIFNIGGDEQVPTALSIISHDLIFETLLEKCWAPLENILQEPLIPTYAYGRLYHNGDELKQHTDREACEISVTVQLGRTHHYSYPIYMGNQRFDLAEGDGVIYKGCEIPHWREVCAGPYNYMSGQLFLHYVKENGINANHGFDVIVNRPEYKDKEIPLVRNRQNMTLGK
jgi:hypothetical protein